MDNKSKTIILENFKEGTMKFGIIGTNWITDKLLDAGSEIKEFELTAVYSRTEEKAREFALKYGVNRVFTSLEEMAQSDEIEAVYIASPNSLHAEQSILFLKNRKAVLCEKPSTSNVSELEEVIKVARENGVLYMEAMKIPFIPSYSILKENMYRIGKVRKIIAGYCQYSSRYGDYLKGDIKNAFRPEFSNGALMDIGIYPLFFTISLFGSPENLKADGMILENGKGIDAYGTLNLSYEDKDAVIMFSKIYNSYIPTEIIGEDGSFLVEHPSEVERVYYIDRKNDNRKVELTASGKKNSMYYELKHFIDLFIEKRTESPINSWNLTLQVRKLMDEARSQMGIVFPADIKKKI